MDYKTYRFILETQQVQTAGIQNGGISNITNGAAGIETTGAQAFITKSAQQTVNQTLLNPLNQATGGLANPIIRLGKAVGTGASAGAIGGGGAMLAVAAVKLAINQVQTRITKLETQVDKLNEKDNSLIRGGYATDATFYSYNLFSGVHTVDRR